MTNPQTTLLAVMFERCDPAGLAVMNFFVWGSIISAGIHPW